MTHPHTAGRAESPIPADIYERAEILMDQFRHIEDDRELIARVLMEALPKANLGLTQPQQRALSFIADYIAKSGVSPSYSDIAAGLGHTSKGPVHSMIHQLVERGAIQIGSRRARSISIIGGADGSLQA